MVTLPTRIALIALAFLTVLTSSPPARAAADVIRLSQLKNDEIAPDGRDIPGISAILQDDDGFLWLATSHGLLRFDGVKADQPYASLLKGTSQPFSLFIDRLGRLWVGHLGGGITLIDHGVATAFNGRGLPEATAYAILERPNGEIWAATPLGVARFDGKHWSAPPPSIGAANDHPLDFAIDVRTGDLYLSGEHARSVRLPRDGKEFVETSEQSVVSARTGLPPSAQWKPKAGDDGALLYDGAHALWHADDVGLSRFLWDTFPPAGQASIKETLTDKNGLSSNSVRVIFRDREGNVWVATNTSLHRFRTPHIRPAVVPQSLDFPVVAPAKDGGVWIGHAGGTPIHVNEGDVRSVPALGDGVSAIAVDNEGAVWAAGLDGLRKARDGHVEKIPLPDELKLAGTRMNGIIFDQSACTWLIVRRFGLYRLCGQTWDKMSGSKGLPDAAPLFGSTAPDDSLWLTYQNNVIARWSSGHVTLITAIDGIRIGDVTSLFFDKDGTWIGGSQGAAWFDGSRATSIHIRGWSMVNVTGILRDSAGDLWIADSKGTNRIGKSALGVAKLGGAVSWEHFDLSDGLRGDRKANKPSPSIVADGKGYLWALTNSAVAKFLPTDVKLNGIAPQPSVLSLETEDQRFEPAKDLVLPPLARIVRIDYTAPMLRRPELGRFEYRLDGVDDAWQDAEGRRSVVYTNLSPGEYLFHVRAFNEDGVPSSSNATVMFYLAPAWFQTSWFRVAIIMVVLLVLISLMRWRMLQVTRRMQIRIDERERIARELHDTFLQGVQGLILKFHSVRKHTDSQHALRIVDDILEKADQVLAEGRVKVHGLREGESPSMDIAERLTSVAHELSQDRDFDYRVITNGRRRALESDALEETYRIGREAILNAFQHGEATRITVEIDYGTRTFVLRVADNGKGLDDDLLRDGARPGHWGCLGCENVRLGSEDTSAYGVHCSLAQRLTYAFRRQQCTPIIPASGQSDSGGDELLVENKSSTDGDSHSMSSVASLQLRQDTFHVRLNSLLSHAKTNRDLLIRTPLCDEVNHSNLPLGEVLGCHPYGEVACNFTRDTTLPCKSVSDRRNEFAAKHAFQKVPIRTGFESTQCLNIALVGC